MEKTTETDKLMKKIVCDNKDDLAFQAALFFKDKATNSVKDKGVFYVALSGGSTPKALYDQLVREEFKKSIPWDKIHFFVSDERCVKIESLESNFGNAQRLLLEPLGINRSQWHPTKFQEMDPTKSSYLYENEIQEYLANAKYNKTRLPSFDLIFLGMGADGHTASLFPDSLALQENEKLVCTNYIAKLDSTRITFTYKLLNSASSVAFLVSGKDKSQVLKEVMKGQGNYPCQLVQPITGELIWYLDKDAASFS